jgi:outer membrane immunogenic protein
MKLIKFVLVSTALSSVVVACAASAADMPPRPYYKPVPPPYLWTGFYVGAHLGGGWFDPGFGGTAGGVVGGGQIGYNFQAGNWVWGGELEASGTSVSKNLGAVGSFNVDSVTTLTARGGYALDRWLIYGKAGVGWVDVSANGPNWGGWGTTTGGVFGVGTEYALSRNWSAKLEYEFIDLGSEGPYNNTSTFQTLKAGVNYKFGGPAWPF